MPAAVCDNILVRKILVRKILIQMNINALP